MQPHATPLQCQHCGDDQNFTIDAAQSLACGAVEHQRRGGLLRRCSSQASTMIKISPLMQLSASRTQLQSTNAEACCLDTAATGSDDGPDCCPYPRLQGKEKHQRRRCRSSLRCVGLRIPSRFAAMRHDSVNTPPYPRSRCHAVGNGRSSKDQRGTSPRYSWNRKFKEGFSRA